MDMEDLRLSSHHAARDSNELNLPPVDGGKQAWLFLAACFVLEALIWGMSSIKAF